MKKASFPFFVHQEQAHHKPLYEWAFGKKIDHPETSARVERILAALQKDPIFKMRNPAPLPTSALTDIHNENLIKVLKAARKLPEGKTFYPSVFPRRDQVSSDVHLIQQAGYYCFDSGTPLTRHTWDAAFWSASAAYSAAKHVASGKAPAAYALSRPPGHHAQEDLFGGYCYFNNAGIAARFFRRLGKVALVDIDFHHGNGTQTIFYPDPKVFFASIHGDPRKFYPFFSGYRSETGVGEGLGLTLNVPLPAKCDGQEYRRVLRRKVLPSIAAFKPDFLVISAGFDTFKSDPIGDFDLETADYAELAWEFARLRLPTAIIQEGGYATRWLGVNVAAFLRGFHEKHSLR